MDFESAPQFSHAEKIEFLVGEFQDSKNGLTPYDVMKALEAKSLEHGVGEQITMDMAVAFIEELEREKVIERAGTTWKVKS